MKPVLPCIFLIFVVLTSSAGVATAQSADIDHDSVVTSITLDDSGDAVWTIEYRTSIEDEPTREAFDSLQSDIRSDPASYLASFEDRTQQTVGAAENQTERKMAVEDVEIDIRTLELPEEYGVVEYSFVWTNFSVVDGETIAVGDSLGGFFIEDDSRLILQWDDEYAVKRTSPDPTATSDTRAVWEGPVDFNQLGSVLVLYPAENVPSEPPTPDPEPTPDPPVPDGPDASESPSAVLLTASALLITGLLLAVLYVVVPQSISKSSETEPEPTTDSSPRVGDQEENGVDNSGEEKESSEPDEDLLSNEERVLRVIKDNGGRVKQQQIVGELDWTDAKTSLVVNGMREEGEVEVFKLGRENVVSLPDEDMF